MVVSAAFLLVQQFDNEFDIERHPDGIIVEVPIWPLSKDGAENLSKALVEYCEVRTTKNVVIDFLERWMPELALAAAFYEEVSPRAQFSWQQKRKRHEEALATQSNSPSRFESFAARNGTVGVDQGINFHSSPQEPSANV